MEQRDEKRGWFDLPTGQASEPSLSEAQPAAGPLRPSPQRTGAAAPPTPASAPHLPHPRPAPEPTHAMPEGVDLSTLEAASAALRDLLNPAAAPVLPYDPDAAYPANTPAAATDRLRPTDPPPAASTPTASTPTADPMRAGEPTRTDDPTPLGDPTRGTDPTYGTDPRRGGAAGIGDPGRSADPTYAGTAGAGGEPGRGARRGRADAGAVAGADSSRPANSGRAKRGRAADPARKDSADRARVDSAAAGAAAGTTAADAEDRTGDNALPPLPRRGGSQNLTAYQLDLGAGASAGGLRPYRRGRNPDPDPTPEIDDVAAPTDPPPPLPRREPGASHVTAAGHHLSSGTPAAPLPPVGGPSARSPRRPRLPQTPPPSTAPGTRTGFAAGEPAAHPAIPDPATPAAAIPQPTPPLEPLPRRQPRAATPPTLGGTAHASPTTHAPAAPFVTAHDTASTSAAGSTPAGPVPTAPGSAAAMPPTADPFAPSSSPAHGGAAGGAAETELPLPPLPRRQPGASNRTAHGRDLPPFDLFGTNTAAGPPAPPVMDSETTFGRGIATDYFSTGRFPRPVIAEPPPTAPADPDLSPLDAARRVAARRRTTGLGAPDQAPAMHLDDWHDGNPTQDPHAAPRTASAAAPWLPHHAPSARTEDVLASHPHLDEPTEHVDHPAAPPHRARYRIADEDDLQLDYIDPEPFGPPPPELRRDPSFVLPDLDAEEVRDRQRQRRAMWLAAASLTAVLATGGIVGYRILGSTGSAAADNPIPATDTIVSTTSEDTSTGAQSAPPAPTAPRTTGQPTTPAQTTSDSPNQPPPQTTTPATTQPTTTRPPTQTTRPTHTKPPSSPPTSPPSSPPSSPPTSDPTSSTPPTSTDPPPPPPGGGG